MQRASKLFTSEQRQHVARAVTAAEAGTSCEIVPVVATASGRYDRPEDIVGVWMGVLAAMAVARWCPPRPSEPGSWGVDAALWMPLVVLPAFMIGAAAASRIGWLRRLFTPRAQMRAEVAARARQVFFDQRVYRTRGDTGVLIYVSLFERMAAVLASQAILDKLGTSLVDRLCRQLTDGLRQGHPTEALCAVIADAGRQLSAPFPRVANDVNELSDALVVID